MSAAASPFANACFRDDFAALAARHPDRPALIDGFGGPALSYRELGALMERCAALFQALFQEKSAPGSGPILALAPNSMAHLIAFLTTLRAGLGYAPIAHDASVRETRNWFGLVKPRLCLVDERVDDATRDFLAETGVPVVTINADPGFGWLPEASAAATPPADHAPRLYLTTSGSTGAPKALAFDSDRLWASARSFASHHPWLDAEARFFNILPMSYLGGLFNLGLIPLACGGSTVVADAFSGRSVLSFWEQIARFDINVLWLVPAMVRGLLTLAERTGGTRAPDHPASRVRAAFLGTAPLALEVKARFEALTGIPLLENLGLSETTFLTSETLASETLASETLASETLASETLASETLDSGMARLPGAVGQRLPEVDLKLRAHPPADDGEAASESDAPAAGEPPMEILARTPFMFLGYLQPDGLLDLPLDADGYLPTGDIGTLDAHDTLILGGRLRDVIKKGGYFVSLREIEVLAEGFDGVTEAAAAAVAHPFYGEDFHLYLRLEAGRPEAETLKDFNAWLHDNLVKYKWPGAVHALADFPRTPSGKVRKHLLAPPAKGAS